MRVGAFIVCREVTLQPDGTHSITGVGADIFRFDSFPAPAVVPIYVVVLGDHESADHHLLIQVIDLAGELLTESLQPVRWPTTRPEVLPDGWEMRMATGLRLEVTFPAPGPYLLEASMDGGGQSLTHPIFIETSLPQ